MSMWYRFFTIVFSIEIILIKIRNIKQKSITFLLKHIPQFFHHHLPQHRIIVAMIEHDKNNILVDNFQVNKVNYNVAYLSNLLALEKKRIFI